MNGKLKAAIACFMGLALLLTFSFGCAKEEGKALEARFTAQPTSGTPPLEVQFTDQSTGEITAWLWDFGDGQASTQQSPSHTYDTVGEYTVSLKVIGPAGSDTETKADYVTVSEVEKVTITIGELTDFTGPAASALTPCSWALHDVAEYINEEGLIPGVELEVISYDTKHSSDRFVPGYEWLRDQGAQVIVCSPPAYAEANKARAEMDKIPIVCFVASLALVEPPGWVFCLPPLKADKARTLVEWISESDWDYQTEGRIPKIGVVGIAIPPATDEAEAVEAYCQAHPDKFDYVGSYLAPYGTMTWATAVAALEDCDYVYISPIGGTMPATFISQFRAAGCTAKFIGTASITAYLGVIEGKVGWEALDGTLTTSTHAWWTYEAPAIDLAKQLLFEYHPKEAYDTIRSGIGALSGAVWAQYFFEMVKAIVEEMGAENFDGQAFYDTAITTTIQLENLPEVTFTNTDRIGSNSMDIWEWSAAEMDLVRVSDWLPVTE